MTDDESVGDLDDIEITPEMIEAGCRAFALCESYDPRESIVADVYLAMARAKAPVG